MSTPALPHALVAALADQLGIGPLDTDDHGVSIFSFEDIDLMLAADEQSFTVFARVGEAPHKDVEFLESLLSANLFWQDTDGATLAIEPDSRAVIIAKRLAASEVDSAEALGLLLETFTRTAIAWTQTLERLRPSDIESPTPLGLVRA